MGGERKLWARNLFPQIQPVQGFSQLLSFTGLRLSHLIDPLLAQVKDKSFYQVGVVQMAQSQRHTSQTQKAEAKLGTGLRAPEITSPSLTIQLCPSLNCTTH